MSLSFTSESEAFDAALRHHQAGNLTEAATIYRQLLLVQPRHADTLYLLGRTELAQNRFEQAIQLFREAVAADGTKPQYHNYLGEAVAARDQLDEAVASFQEALRLKPDYIDAALNLGKTWFRAGMIEQAIAAYQIALLAEPANDALYFHLGVALEQAGRWNEALAAFQRATELNPRDAESPANMGAILNEMGNAAAAIEVCERAIRINPQVYTAHCNLGVCWQSQGRLDDAIRSFRTAVALCPENARQHSNLIYALNFHPGYDAATIFAEHRNWAQRHADPLTAASTAHANDRTPTRRLRLGYVSGHFRTHAVNRFFEPILAAHDHDGFEVFCYSNVSPPQRDETTRRLQGYADHWRDIAGLSDEQANQLVRNDRIDILVDLSGHIAGERLLVFARNPAPVQATYLGYQNTTGMLAMDFRLTDTWSDPPGETDDFYSERLVRLPQSFFCYLPLPDAPTVSACPMLENGYVTFGSFNNFAKVTPDVLETWAEILVACPKSRLLVLAPLTESTKDRVRHVFLRHGVDVDRVSFVDRQSPREFHEQLSRVDIALDPFPFNGHTTTCDALWMGVPVVMLAGRTYASRFGGSTLKTLGLDTLIASGREQYVEIAVELANDGNRLRSLRVSLRDLMQASPLLDGAAFTRNLESAYRTMWADWCAK